MLEIIWDQCSGLICYVFLIFSVILALFLVVLVASKDYRQSLFADLWSSESFREWRDNLFTDHKLLYLNELRQLKPNKPTEKLKILEVGAGDGINFRLLPENSVLTALDFNSNFKKKFIENLKLYPRITFDKFYDGNVEAMDAFDDNTFDVVLATHVFCSVNNVPQALQEIKRVLKKGGKFFFAEHVMYHDEFVSHRFWTILQYIMQPIWKIVFDGCILNKKTWEDIENAKFETVAVTHNYPSNMPGFFRPHIWGCATK